MPAPLHVCQRPSVTAMARPGLCPGLSPRALQRSTHDVHIDTTSSRVEAAALAAWGLHKPAAQAVGPGLHSAMRCPRGAGTRNCAKLKGCTAGTPLSPGTINAVVTQQQQQRHYGGMTA